MSKNGRAYVGTAQEVELTGPGDVHEILGMKINVNGGRKATEWLQERSNEMVLEKHSMQDGPCVAMQADLDAESVKG